MWDIIHDPKERDGAALIIAHRVPPFIKKLKSQSKTYWPQTTANYGGMQTKVQVFLRLPLFVYI